jgi:mRNA interferase YafQ
MTRVIEPKYHVVKTARFRQGYKLAKKQGKDLSLLAFAIDQLSKDIPLPTNWKDHPLKGNLKNYRECHIDGSSDWLLLYEKSNNEMILYLLGTGSHDDLLE